MQYLTKDELIEIIERMFNIEIVNITHDRIEFGWKGEMICYIKRGLLEGVNVGLENNREISSTSLLQLYMIIEYITANVHIRRSWFHIGFEEE